ncbi:hypothetical protein N7466_005174 [Penicillium verhagenii]|uniref:uncharacterized protein n=1 Tax=Penicillium verhagenii TaxID=1562060 RepID=UPI002545117C|nr:uncharacterized protein N7466_005174 [Penicillium verhagenii]KAJ5935627.1 hypothetical protein N7466_005174 [Penicillium verhagenii]
MPSSKAKLNQHLNTYTQTDQTDKTKDFLNGFFGVLSPHGKSNLVDDISQCSGDNEKLRQLVRSIETGLIIPLKAHGGKTPTDITPSPRPGVEDSIENLKTENIEPVSRSQQSQLCSHCLERDEFRCLATGRYSGSHPHPQGAPTTYLEAAHIIPFTLGSFRHDDFEAVDRYATIWVNLSHYFPMLRQISFTSEHINSEKNILMLSMMVHKEFGQFRIIFEATGVTNQYRIKAFPDAVSDAVHFLPRNRLVKFRSRKGWEVPDPALLKIHASIGNFLHMSGRAEAVDKVLRDFDDCGGLATDGSSNIKDLLAVSRLSLLPINVNKMPSTEETRAELRQRFSTDRSGI